MSLADDVLKEQKAKILKTLEHFRQELMAVRTGRASLHLLDGIRVDYYGTPTPLHQVATLAVADARLITVKPWEKNMIPVIEKSIREANIGLNPQSDKDLVRVPVPPLTEERRRELVKHCRKLAEDYRVSVRSHRRDAIEMLKSLEKDGDITEDDRRHTAEKVEALTKEYIERVDKVLKGKEDEIMAV